MSEVRTPYDIRRPYADGRIAETPSEQTRLLLMTVRQALLMIVAGIEKYLGIAPKR